MITTIKQNGSLRLCIDPHHLNQELKRSHYPLPVIDDILPDLHKVNVFSKADLQEGFLQVGLDEGFSLCTDAAGIELQQSNNLSIILKKAAVSWVSGGEYAIITFETISLRTCVARLTCIFEKLVR
jgi:hypothetical protein